MIHPTPYAGTATPGAYLLDMPNADYHGADGVSKSGLDLVERSPAHYRYRVSKSATRGMELGTAIHTALLEPERFAVEYMLLRDVKDRRASEYKQAAKVYGSECTLTGPEADKVAGMQEAVYANPHARKLLEAEGWRELSGFVRDPETGILCRHRPDLLTTSGTMVDLKKTQDARPDAFSRAVYNYRYHVQAAFYMDQYFWMTGERVEHFQFLAVEEELPHGVKIYTLDDDAIAIGREAYRANLRAYAECVETADWPCYDSEPELLSLPGWAVAQYENELEDGGII